MARTRHLDGVERIDALRASLPDDVIGRHALAHATEELWREEIGR